MEFLEMQHDIALEAVRGRDSATLTKLLLSYVGNIAENTKAQYRGMASTIVDDLPPLDAIDRTTARRYVTNLEAKYKPATVRMRLTVAKLLYRMLDACGIDHESPFDDLKAKPDPRPEREQGKTYSENELELLLEHADNEERALLTLCGHAGLRVSEALAARWLDLNQDKGTLHVVGKGGAVSTAFLSKTTLEALDQLPRDDQYILPWRNRSSAFGRMKALCKRAGVEFKAVHALRHAAGEWIYETTNGNIMLVARLLRHRSIATADRYVSNRERELSRIMARR